VPDPYLSSVLKAIAEDALDTESPRLISVDELRAAGALDVPAAWRKSLGVERDLFSGLFGDEDMLPEDQQPASLDAAENNSADELP
jgi:hypothetical protein